MSPQHPRINKSSPFIFMVFFGGTLLTSGCETSDSTEIDESVPDDDDLKIDLDDDQTIASLPSDGESIRQTRIYDGEALTLVKRVDEHANITSVILDAMGEEIDPTTIRHVAPDPLSVALRSAIEQSPHDADLEVLIGLAEPLIHAPLEAPEHGQATIDGWGRTTVELNGVRVTARELEVSEMARVARIDAQVLAIADARRGMLRELARRKPGFMAHPNWRSALERGDASVILPLRADEIEDFAERNADLVAGIELRDFPVNLIGAAMLDTLIDPHALGNVDRRGLGIGIYMSEIGCPDPGFIDNYTRLSGVSDNHNKNVSAILRSVSPSSYVYCRGGAVLPSGADLLGYDGNARIYMETHSWGYVNSDNASFLLADRDFDNHVYDTAVNVFNAAGNFGADNGFVISPAKAVNVISVGNYNDATDIINGSSSFRDSEIGNTKPELSAPGTGICAGGICMTGTSQASPHTAAFAADLLSAYAFLRLRPATLNAFLLAATDKLLTGGTDKIGVGGLNFRRAYVDSFIKWYEGSNAAFASYDASDAFPNNGTIDYVQGISANPTNVRAVIQWLNRGTFTYDHRADLHPLGMDLDLCVIDPLGVTIGCSTSLDNSFEMVSFDPTITGNYRFRITRSGNADPSSKLHVGFILDWK